MGMVRKIVYSCKFGGIKYLAYKISDKLSGSNKAFKLTRFLAKRMKANIQGY